MADEKLLHSEDVIFNKPSLKEFVRLIKNGTINATKRALAVFNGGSLTIGEGADVISGDVAVSANGAGSEVVMDGGSITAQESGVLVTTGAKLEMR